MPDKDFIIKSIVKSDLKKELSQIGFDDSYIEHASNKYIYKNIKIYNLTPAQANIIKQTALATGTDCAVHRDVITGNVEKSDIILGGSYDQLYKISEKLKLQPFSLNKLSEKLKKELTIKNTKTKLVGILNITPNSFSDGGKYNTADNACKHLEELIKDGADVIDIGAESTKPNAPAVEPDIQLQKILPVLEYIKSSNITIPISIDTRSSVVAKACLESGAKIINDVSGLKYDNKMAEVIASYDATVVIQHSLGNEITKKDHIYKNLTDEIFIDLYNQIKYAESFGIKNIIADVGIGFDKTRVCDIELIKRIEEFSSLNYPLMLGISRKSFLGLGDSSNEEKDIYTLAFNMLAINNNVDYIRIHNVKLHKKLLDILNK